MDDDEQRLTRYERDVLRSAAKNHMWISAFATIRPSDELKQQIGEWVLSRIRDPEYTIQADFDDGPLANFDMPEVILRFNSS